jgi:hypothetical protein
VSRREGERGRRVWRERESLNWDLYWGRDNIAGALPFTHIYCIWTGSSTSVNESTTSYHLTSRWTGLSPARRSGEGGELRRLLRREARRLPRWLVPRHPGRLAGGLCRGVLARCSVAEWVGRTVDWSVFCEAASTAVRKDSCAAPCSVV